MRWFGRGKTRRILALVYYDADTQWWHIGDSMVHREMLENIDINLAHSLVAAEIGRNTETLRRVIAGTHTLKGIEYGY